MVHHGPPPVFTINLFGWNTSVRWHPTSSRSEKVEYYISEEKINKFEF